MTNRSLHACTFALLLLCAPGVSVAGAGSDERRDLHREMAARDAEWRAEQARLSGEYSRLAEQGDRLQEKLAMLLAQASIEDEAPLAGRKLAQAEPAPANRGVVQLLNQVEALNGEINRLRGQMEVLSNDIANAQKRQRDMYVDLDTRLRRIEQGAGKKDQDAINALDERIRRLEQGNATSATIPPPVTSTPSVPPASAANPGAVVAAAPAAAAPAAGTTASTSLPPATLSATDQATIQRAYDNAYSNYRLSDYPSAIRGFDSFLKSYPKHALAGNAQYWIGESYSHLRQYREAIEAERRLLGAYPDSPKAADALLIIGTAEGSLGDTAAARKTFEDLLAKYPGTDAADKAKQRLAKLK